MGVKDTRKFYKKILDSVSAGIVLIGMHGFILAWNKKASKIFDKDEKDVIGSSFDSFFPNSEKKKLQKYFYKAYHSKEEIPSGVFQRITENNKKQFIEIALSKFMGDLVDKGLMLTLRDETYKIITQKMEDRRHDYYLSIVGHEFKTPLASIKAFAQIAQKRIEQGKVKKVDEYLSKIDSHVNELTKLISDLIDVARISAGRLEVFEEVFDFDGLLDETIKEFEQLFKKHRIIKNGSAKKNIIADKIRIRQVLVNLISNAVKHSPNSDKIIINTSSCKGNINMSVQDFGLGIPREKHNDIFEPFFRAGDLKKDASSGLGLGLHISSEVVKMHGGKLWVESREGKGSIFYLTLPIKRKKRILIN